MPLPTNWMDQLALPSNKYCKLLQRYCDAFKPIFRCELKLFAYERWMKNGLTMWVSNIPRISEIYFEYEGYKDNPFFIEYDFVRPGIMYTWPDHTQDEKYIRSNLFRHKVQKEFNIHTTFSIVEKTLHYCHYFSWDFVTPIECLDLQQEKNIILEDFIINHKLINTIIEQFKMWFFPIIEKEEFCRVNLKDLSKVYHQDNNVIQKNIKIINPNVLLSTKVIEENDLKLMNVKLSILEHTVLKLYLRGMTADEISKYLYRSKRTIEGHIDRIKIKIGANKRSEIYIVAEKLKLMGII